MLFPWEAAGLGDDEARIVGESADALLEFMVGQSRSAIEQGDGYDRLFDESLNIFQRGMRDVARSSKALTGVVTHNTRVALAKATDNDLGRIGKALADLPASFRSDLHQSASATAQGILEIIRRDNLDMAARARTTWYGVVSRAVSQVNTGSLGYEEAVRRATLELADRGIRTVDYRSGISSDVDVAVRRHVMTQIKQAGARRTMALCEELGVELVEVTRSGNPRPSHSRWEGRIYRIVNTRDDYPDFWEGTGYQGLRGPYTALGDQLDGVNCKHDFGPYDEALDPMWGDDPLTEEEHERRYDLSQEQRRLEREVRKAKRAAHLLEVAGVPNVRERAKVGNYQRQLRRLVSDNPDVLQRDYARERLNGYRDPETGQEAKQPAPLNRELESRTSYLNKQASRQVMKDAGVSQKLVNEGLRADFPQFGLLTPAEQDRAFQDAINGALMVKATAEAMAEVGTDARPLKVRAGKQNQHFEGTEEWNERVKKLEPGDPLPSSLTPGINVQELVNRYSGTGEMEAYSHGKGVIEIIEYCKVDHGTIGKWRNQDGAEEDTDRFAIHYSKSGTHIVPAQPSWLRK